MLNEPSNTQKDTVADDAEPSPASRDLRNMAVAVWALYVAGFVTGGLTQLIGVVLAHMKRKEARGTVFESHMRVAVKTFWIGFLVSMISVPLMFVGIGFLLAGAVAVVVGVISVVGLVKAMEGKPFSSD